MFAKGGQNSYFDTFRTRNKYEALLFFTNTQIYCISQDLIKKLRSKWSMWGKQILYKAIFNEKSMALANSETPLL